MRRIEKQDILVPLLSKSYQNETEFYNSFSDQIQKGGELCLSDPFGVSIIITNIINKEHGEMLINSLKKNECFSQTIEGKDSIDKGLFEENAIYSFKRHVFRSKEGHFAGFKD